MIEVVVLGLGLAMDAFAVSIGLGATMNQQAHRQAFKIACFFGGFQAFMPLLGYGVGVGMNSIIGSIHHWLASLLLMFIGGNILYKGNQKEDESQPIAIQTQALLYLALATSIDAMAAGFSLNILEVQPLVAIIIIGLITFCLSYMGVFLGIKGSRIFEQSCEQVGGIILIAIGVKILLTTM